MSPAINLDDFKKYLRLCKIFLISVYTMSEYKLQLQWNTVMANMLRANIIYCEVILIPYSHDDSYKSWSDLFAMYYGKYKF